MMRRILPCLPIAALACGDHGAPDASNPWADELTACGGDAGAGGESASCTTLTGTTGTIVDASGSVWTLVRGSDGSLVIDKNGAPAGYSDQVTRLVYVNHVVWQENSAGGWWSWVNGTWQAGSNPTGACGVADASVPDSSSDASTPSDAGSPSAPDSSSKGDTAAPPPVAGRTVFAHYMLTYCPHGCSVAGYEQDIKDAQAVGVDGFALDFGSWSQQPRYIANMANMYQAANNLGTGFKLMQSPDCSTPASLPVADVINAATTYCGNPAQFTYNGKCALSAYSASTLGNPAFWQTNVLTPLANAGHPVVFVPHLFMGGEMPTTSSAAATESTWNSTVDGYFMFGAAGVPTYTDSPSLLKGAEAAASVTLANNKIFMAPMSMQYWGAIQPGRRYFEYYGGQGTENQWQSIINVQKPQWVELVTWDDFAESYMTPSTAGANAGYNFPWSTTPHGGGSMLASYFIQWYKTGVQPSITKDELFYFYRQSPKSSASTCTSDPHGTVNQLYGNVTDSIFVTTLLTGSATLTVNTGGSISTYNLGAGITHTTIPFTVGPTQTLQLTRNGTTLTSLTGPAIVPPPAECNFFYATGYGFSDGTHYP
jgi:glucan endo-1,3-alpha-glucosidase